jgi:hypothetical protein
MPEKPKIHEGKTIWELLAEPMPDDVVKWRQSTKPKKMQDGSFKSLYVCYVEGTTVRQRLEAVVPGRWSETIVESLAPIPPHEKQDDPFDYRPMFATRVRLTITGPDGVAVVRDGIGHGKDYKAAATDAFKRAGVMFGIAAELYDLPKVFVVMESGEKYAKPAQEISAAVAVAMAKRKRKVLSLSDDAENAPAADNSNGQGKTQPEGSSAAGKATQPQEPDPKNVINWGSYDVADTPNVVRAKLADAGVNLRTVRLLYNGFEAVPACPECGGRMIDMRATKLEKRLNPRSPDWKCADLKHQKDAGQYPKSCDGKFWPDELQIGWAKAVRPALIAVNGPVEGQTGFKWTIVEPDLREDPTEKKNVTTPEQVAKVLAADTAKDDGLGSVFD